VGTVGGECFGEFVHLLSDARWSHTERWWLS
jgi:hypothetical protein